MIDFAELFDRINPLKIISETQERAKNVFKFVVGAIALIIIVHISSSESKSNIKRNKKRK